MRRFAIAVLCALAVAGCKLDDISGDAADAAVPPQQAPIPPPSTAAPSPTFTSTNNGSPTVYIETDPVSGDKYIRVEEQRFDPISGSAAKSVSNRTFDGYDTAAFRVSDSPGATVDVDSVTCKRTEFCLFFARTGVMNVYNLTVTDFQSTSIYGQGIFLGNEGPNTVSPTTGIAYVQRVFSDAQEAPDFTYDVSNTDFISSEWNNAPVYVRDATIRNWGDAGIDAKSSIYIMNATIENGFHALKIWSRVWHQTSGEPNRFVVVNSIIKGKNWLQSPFSIIEYYNTTWNGKSAPSESDVYSDDYNNSTALSWVHRLSSNPLPAMSPFFRTNFDRIRLQYSTNNGGTWQAMDVPNTGENGVGPIGDTRYRIPVNLSSATYIFRAYYEKGGQAVGGFSRAVDESGNPV